MERVIPGRIDDVTFRMMAEPPKSSACPDGFDVADDRAVHTAFTQIDAVLERVDVLINNAGISRPRVNGGLPVQSGPGFAAWAQPPVRSSVSYL